MRGNNENIRRETDAAFAAAAFLLNVLILLVLCVGGWLLHSLVLQNDALAGFLNQSMLR